MLRLTKAAEDTPEKVIVGCNQLVCGQSMSASRSAYNVGVFPSMDPPLMTLSIYHNPRCSKSRQTLEILINKGLEPNIIEYLDNPPNVATLENIAAMLNADPVTIMRTNEEEYKTAQSAIEAMNKTEQIKWLAANIRVLQRPIVINGNLARIGRPPESVLEILD